MRSFHANLGAGIDGLVMREHETPTPGPGEVLVRVRASSLSFRELMILRGWYPLPIKQDVVPVSDGAGEVVAVGRGVTRFAVGDRVAATLFPDWQDGTFTPQAASQLGGSIDGMLTDYAVLAERALVHIPRHLSYEQASTLPCAGVTAWNALTGGRGRRAGETVLTLGSGGASLFERQIANASGARVIATAGGEAKAAPLLELGADDLIDRHATPDWPMRVRELTDGAGADHVVEVTGLLEPAIEATALKGEIAFVGLLSDEQGLPPIDPKMLWLSGADVRTVTVGSHAQFRALNRAFEVNRLEPVIDSVFDFADSPAAYRYYESARPVGKVVLAHG